MEDRYDTDIDDLWSALTDPQRLARWLGEVDGDLRQGGEFRARYFASGWEGTGRVEVCEPSRRLLVLTKDADEPGEHAIEVTLAAEGTEGALTSEGVVVDRIAPDDQAPCPPGIGIQLDHTGPAWEKLYQWLKVDDGGGA